LVINPVTGEFDLADPNSDQAKKDSEIKKKELLMLKLFQRQ
jgi:hypothetical protein